MWNIAKFIVISILKLTVIGFINVLVGGLQEWTKKQGKDMIQDAKAGTELGWDMYNKR
jgi:hypothetical protein